MMPRTPTTDADAAHRLDLRRAAALLTTDALQNAIFTRANFSSIATDASGVRQLFNVGAGRLLS